MAGMGIDAAQALMTTHDSFKNGWKQARSENVNTWLYLGLFVTLVLLALCTFENHSASQEAKRFAEHMIKRYARQNHIDISNFNKQDFQNVANLILSYIPKDKASQLLKNCAKAREELYHDEMRALKHEISMQEYDGIFKTRIVEITNYVTPIIEETMVANPSLQKLILNMATGTTKYIPVKMFAHQK